MIRDVRVSEPLRVCRRFQILRDWSNEQVKEMLSRGPRAGQPHGVRARTRLTRRRGPPHDPSRRRSAARLRHSVAGFVEPSVCNRGDSYDNALTESVISLLKTEVIHHEGPWRGLEDVEIATLEWVWWYNERRLMEPLGYLPPAEYEQVFHRRQESQALAAALT